MSPWEFSDEEITTFRKKNKPSKQRVFEQLIALFFKNTNMKKKTKKKKKKKTKFCLSWPNKTLKISGRLRNIGILLTERTIMPY